MIISPGRNYIFVHIPKTGGTALALALEGRAQAEDILIGDTPKAQRRRARWKGVRARGRLWKHATLADIDGLVSAAAVAEAFTFTLVRNPWDRMVSYYHWLRGQDFEHSAVHLAKTHDFAGFLAVPETQAALRANPARRYMTAADGQEQCRLYIRLEHLEADAAPLWAHLGFTLAVARANASERGHYRDYYGTREVAIVAECAAEDIARFGYDF
ncbi:sulfotransferase family 2 domain-containing protein [uncultured Roseovarius sp.]|uniref:sulfotransferase family 2 domain-containing protein n=1 Tax=uncultured Roseovarius sp. TaxID=293344 RepID=UPI002633EC31|nr:sulfotransferase family 2 domain-containing protein [uncultured Roseovarius sp.]